MIQTAVKGNTDSVKWQTPVSKPMNGPHLRLIVKVIDRIESSPSAYHVVYLFWKSVILSNMRSVELAFAFFSVVAGFWMGWPLQMQHKSNSQIYNVLVNHLPPGAWTCLFLSFGVPALVGCNRDRKFFPKLCVSRKVRIFAAAMSLWCWGFISVIFIYDKSPGLSTVWAPIVTAYQFWIMLWLWVNDNTTPCSKE